MFNKLILIVLLSISIAHTQAETREWGLQRLPDAPKDNKFSETEMALPTIPNPDTGEWLDLYINETHTGNPRILLDSLQIAEDNSIRYLFNNRSASGYNNITAEGVVCAEGFFNSDGLLQKTFAYADLSNQRWIIPRRSEWKVLGGKRNAADPVRRVLYEIICINNKITHVNQLRKALIQEAGSRR